MRALVWSIRLLIFLVLFAFAAKNTEPVTLKFFFGISWQMPLILLALAFFVIGAFFGLLAMITPWWRQRRKVRRLRRAQARQLQAAPTPDVAARQQQI